jgi:hypothetical protein
MQTGREFSWILPSTKNIIKITDDNADWLLLKANIK